MADVVESSRHAVGLLSRNPCFVAYVLFLCTAYSSFVFLLPKHFPEKEPKPFQRQKAAKSGAAGPDALTVLGFRAGYSPTEAEIRTAYKRAVLQYHPDKNPDDPAAAKKFISLKAAFDSLKRVQ